MQTTVSCATSQIIIEHGRPTVLIGERINPTGKNRLSAAMQAGNLELVRQLASSQVRHGADILDVNVGASGVNEVALLPEAIRAVMETVDVPLCIDSDNPEALAAALQVYVGKPIVNSVNGQEQRLQTILPLAREHGAVVIGLTMDDQGIPNDADRRVAIAGKIIERAAGAGIPPEDIIIDALALSVGADTGAARVTLEAVRRIRDEFGVNQTLGASNVSFGLPDRELINGSFLAMAIAAGVTCPVVYVKRVRPAVLAVDLLLGRDDYAMRYIRAYRQRQKASANGHEGENGNNRNR